MNAIDAVTQDYLKKDIPDFGVGDTVRVHIKIKEGNRERIQIFEGFCSETPERWSRRNFYG